MFSDFSRSPKRACFISIFVILLAVLTPWVDLFAADAPLNNSNITPTVKGTASESDRLLKLAQQYSSTASVAPPTTAPAATATPLVSSPAASYDLPASENRPLGKPRPADAPVVTQRTSLTETSWIPGTLAALGIVIGLAMLLKTLFSRVSSRSGSSLRNNPIVEVLSRTTVSPKNHVLLLRVGQRIMIVNDSPAGMRPLGEITDAQEVASLLTTLEAFKPTSISSNFASILGGMNNQYSDTPSQEIVGGDDAEHHADRTRDGLGGLLARLRSNSREDRR